MGSTNLRDHNALQIYSEALAPATKPPRPGPMMTLQLTAVAELAILVKVTGDDCCVHLPYMCNPTSPFL
jgi:hypothetical protein